MTNTVIYGPLVVLWTIGAGMGISAFLTLLMRDLLK